MSGMMLGAAIRLRHCAYRNAAIRNCPESPTSADLEASIRAAMGYNTAPPTCGDFPHLEDRMLSRALSLATAMLLTSFATVPVQAQNLEAGKTPSQIFSGTCTACHKSPRGLLKTVTPGALSGFLRQHYTTSSGMAESLSAYLVSNGATDKRYDAGLTRQ